MPRPRKPPRLERIDPSDQASNWFILWHDGQRDRRRSTNTSDLAAAQGVFQSWLEELNTPAYSAAGPQPLDQFKIADALGLYVQARIEGKPSAIQTATWVTRLLEFWGERTIDAITEQTINGAAGYIAHRRQKRGLKGRDAVSYATIERELTTLRAAVNYCWRQGKLARQPLPIPKAPGTAPRDLWIEPADLTMLLDSAAPHVRLWCLIAISCGGRKAAILQIKWRGQVDFVARTLDLLPPGKVQTTKRRSKVPMTDVLFAALREAHKTAKTPYVVEYPYPKGKDENGVEQFERRQIKDIKNGFGMAARRAVYEAIRRARTARAEGDVEERQRNVAAAWRLRKVTPHTLRHTAATWMAQAGESIDKIGAFIGHNDPRTTARYAHHHPDHMRDLATSLDARIKLGIKPSGGEG